MGIPITALVCGIKSGNTAIAIEKELSRSIGIPIDLLSFKVVTSITDFKACIRCKNIFYAEEVTIDRRFNTLEVKYQGLIRALKVLR